MLRCRPISLLVVLLSSVSLVGRPARTDVIALTGEEAPDGNGTFAGFSPPALSLAGPVIFLATLNDTARGSEDDSGLYEGNSNAVIKLVREGDPLGHPGEVNRLYSAAVDSHSVATLSLTGTSPPHSDGMGLWRMSNWLSDFPLIAIDGAVYIGGVWRGRVLAFSEAAPSAGWVAVRAHVEDDGQYTGIFRAGGLGGAPVPLARPGDPLSPDPGTLVDVDLSGRLERPVLNEEGQCAFLAKLGGTPGKSSDDTGIFVADASPSLIEIVREKDPSPDGNGEFLDFEMLGSDPPLNDAGQVAFLSQLDRTAGGSLDNTALLRGDGTIIELLIREGDPAPDGNGTFADLLDGSGPLTIDNRGAVLLAATLKDTVNPPGDDHGLFRADGASITSIAREGALAPDGANRFSGPIGEFATTPNGQIAFTSATDGPAGRRGGLFWHDTVQGTLAVVQTGDLLLGSAIMHVTWVLTKGQETP